MEEVIRFVFEKPLWWLFDFINELSTFEFMYSKFNNFSRNG